MASKNTISAKTSKSEVKQVILAISTQAQCDRVNPVPTGGTISINGKKPIILLFFNQNQVPVQANVKIANASTGVPIEQFFLINASSSLALDVNIDLGQTMGTKNLIYYKIEIKNVNSPQFEVGYSDFIINI